MTKMVGGHWIWEVLAAFESILYEHNNSNDRECYLRGKVQGY